MKKLVRHGMSLLALVAMSYASQAQRFAATVLDYTNQNPATEHEFGFSTTAFNDYSIYGTQFNQTINIYKGYALMFQAVSPEYLQPTGKSFGHSLAMNQNWIAAGAFQDDLTPADPGTHTHGRVYLSKNINGVPQNNFTSSITAQAPATLDYYGKSIDMGGQWLVVGAPGSSATGKGYIEIWKETATSWERKQKIQPANLATGAEYGFSVAIHGDYMVVGAPGIQTVFVYKNTNNVWALHSSFTPDLSTWKRFPSALSLFGFEVDIYDNRIIVGDGSTAVQKAAILTINATTTTLTETLLPPGYSATQFTHYGWYGYSVAIGEDKAIVGAPSQYGPDITDKQAEGKVFFYGNNLQYLGYMNAGTPANKEIKGLGKSVSIDGEFVLAGAENTNNLATPRSNEGLAFRTPFYYVTETGNTPPAVSITSPTPASNYTAPATVTIEAFANDANGTINRVEFYQNGGTYLGSDNTAPYTFTLTNVTAGNKYVYVKAFDNQGAMAINDVSFTVNASLPPATISGPACGSKNQTLLYELEASKKVNATGYNWYYTGSNQGLTPVTGAAYKVSLATGNNFSGGQLCVGVNYSTAPWYTSYCIDVATCSSNRESAALDNVVLTESKLTSYPNPFTTTSTIDLPAGSSAASIQVLDATGKVVLTTQATGSVTFGNELSAGIYLVKVETSAKTEFIKIVKE